MAGSPQSSLFCSLEATEDEPGRYLGSFRSQKPQMTRNSATQAQTAKSSKQAQLRQPGRQLQGSRKAETLERRTDMEDQGIGWIAAIIIGGVAGWLAEMFMKSNMGVLMNIILGIIGAVVANALLSVFGVVLGGWIGYLIAGFIGACILIAIARMFRGRTV
jgi:uncharacterized membrane protein YeaQ/YmgE (transglycosylase-associated protein family)